MRTLLILRHADSNLDHPELSDYDRPLNEGGRRDIRRMGRHILEHDLSPDLIITSPAKRARSTSERLMQATAIDVRVVTDDRMYGASPTTCVEVLRDIEPDAACVLIVGHNPGLAELASLLTGQRIEMPTAALAVLRLPIESWSTLALSVRGTLAGHWKPRELSAANVDEARRTE